VYLLNEAVKGAGMLGGCFTVRKKERKKERKIPAVVFFP
jgi:hypothetical protein